MSFMSRNAGAAVLAVALAMLPGAEAQGVTVSVSCGSVGAEYDFCKTGAEAWAKKTGNQVRVVSVPKDSNEQLALFQQLLSQKSGEIDVLRIDIIWPGLLAENLLDLGKEVSKDVVSANFPAIVEANTVKGKLVALPQFTDAGLLYYRKDLLEKYGQKVPTTWEEMTQAAKVVQDGERKAGKANMWGFVFQGRAYEGLTCNALEWIDSFQGGTIVGSDGKVTVNNPKAVEALKLASSWIKTISPEGVLNYSEEEARGAFQSGNAVFMRNWPYAWALSQSGDSPVKDKVGVIALPKGGSDGKNTATLGGWNWAVNKYSKNPKQAVDLAMYLSSSAEQKRAALEISINPTLPALFQDQDILAKNPIARDLLPAFQNAVARPSRVTGNKYNQVSSAFWNAVHDSLSGKTQPEQALAGLEKTLNRIGRNGRW